MIVDIVMPKMGESIMEGTILKWLKKPGDKVERDEPILEISTDKVDTEVPSPEAGIITELLFKENEVVEIGKILARLETDADAKIETKAEEKPAEIPAETKPETIKPAEEKKQAAPAAETDKPASASTSDKFFSPLVLNIARKEGIPLGELEGIKGTGQNGRVTKNDVLEYVKSGRKPAPQVDKPVVQTQPAAQKPKPELPKQEINYDEDGISVLEFDNIRQKMAEHMAASVAISPHVNSISECDMTNVEKARSAMAAEFEKKEGIKLTYMPFISEAVIKALKDFPLVNSVIDDSSVPFKAIMRSKVNLGIAVAMENGGLIVPVVKNADGMNLTGLARNINDLGKRARVKKLSLDEIQGGTFTISNYGVFGNIIGTMVINQPQVAILGIGAVKKRPAVLETENGDFVVIKPMMYLTLSFDHRLIDGALGGKFLMRIVHYLENYQA